MALDEQTALEYLSRSQENQRLGHAYLVTGSDRDGRASLTLGILREIVGLEAASLEEAEGEWVVVARPSSLSRRIVVDQIRALEHRLQTASGGQLKVAVIEEADRLQTEASNAFLKTLEEPPADSLILLLTGFPEQLLETVRSRCIRLPMRELPVAERLGEEGKALLSTLREQFPKAGHNGDGALALLGVVNALLRKIKESARGETEALFKEERQALQKTTESDAWLKRREQELKALAQSGYLAQRSDLMAVLLRWMGDCLLQASGRGGQGVAFESEKEESLRVGALLGEENLLQRIECLERLIENLETTVSEPLAIEVGILNAFA